MAFAAIDPQDEQTIARNTQGGVLTQTRDPLVTQAHQNTGIVGNRQGVFAPPPPGEPMPGEKEEPAPTPTPPPDGTGKYPDPGEDPWLPKPPPTPPPPTTPPPAPVLQGYEGLAKRERTGYGTEFADYDVAGASADIEKYAAGKPGESYGTGSTATDVAGQIEALLGADSKVLQLERAKGAQAAQGIGALSSTMGANMGERLVIDKATEIAKADAATRAQFERGEQAADINKAQTETEALISGKLNQQQADINEKQKAIDRAFQAEMTGLGEEGQHKLAQDQAKWTKDLQTTLQRLDSEFQQKMQDGALDAATADSIRAQISSHVMNHQVAIEQLLGNANFMQMGAEGIANTFNSMRDNMIGAVQFLAASAGIADEMAPYFEDLWESFTYDVDEVTNIPPEETT